MIPEDNPGLGLADELRAVERAMSQLKEKPRYDEAALAELPVRHRELVSQIGAEAEIGKTVDGHRC